MVLQATTLREFAERPFGRCVSGDGWLYYASADGALFGIVCWGAVRDSDLDKLKAGMDAGLSPSLQPHVTLIDTRRLRSVDAQAFAVLAGYVDGRRAALTRSVSRLAVVRSDGLLGSVAEGFYQVVAPPYPVQVFADLDRALTWLGVGARAVEAVRAAERMQADVVGLAPFVRDLRAFLEASPSSASLAAAARALGLSPRTFQRRLRDARIRFKSEVAISRIRLAQERLADPGVPITALAMELGFASSQHFSNCFRRVIGTSPSQWRKSRQAVRP